MRNAVKDILYKYREFLFFIHRRPIKGILPSGIPCTVEDPTPDETHGDIVHPCVRYIPEGFEGHHWWMVYTPFYNYNMKIENPRLCYADSENGDAPTHWKYYCTIKEKPEIGYNSDPTIFFKNNRLYIFWRENRTKHTKEVGCARAVFGCYVQNKSITYFNKPSLVEEAAKTDREICPTIVESGSGFRAYSIHIRFNPKWISWLPNKLVWYIYKLRLVEFICLLYGSNRMKTYGVAVWDSDSIENTFHYSKTIKFKGVSRLYRPWHMDLFEAIYGKNKNMFAVIQTNEQFADICLARNIGNDYFQFYAKPLITSKSIGRKGIYKPSAVIIDDTFHLYYTAKDNKDHSLNKMFVASVRWSQLLKKLEK